MQQKPSVFNQSERLEAYEIKQRKCLIQEIFFFVNFHQEI